MSGASPTSPERKVAKVSNASPDPNSMTVKELVLLLNDKADAILVDHEDRIRRLERWRNRFAGALAIVSFVVLSGLPVFIEGINALLAQS